MNLYGGSPGRKCYNILLGIDYDDTVDTWKYDVDTIKNNLLGKKESDGTWKKIEGLPLILVHTVDIVQSRDGIMEKLGERKYDVVICDRKIGDSNIMAGALTVFREKVPAAIFISLLNKSQKRGVQYKDRDGNIVLRDGEGLRRMYDKGFYNALWKDEDFSMEVLINMILSEGRSKKEAAEYYGLNITDEELIRMKRELSGRQSAALEEKKSIPKEAPGPAGSSKPVQTITEAETRQGKKSERSDGEMKQAQAGRQLAKQVEEQTNRGMAMTGVLQGHVVHAAGRVVTLVVNEEIESLGISAAGVMGMPANVFYLKG